MKRNSNSQNGNVEKRRARPKRSIKQPGGDHPLGLWIDKDLLRRNLGLTRTVIHEPFSTTNNRYLELAAVALGVNKSGGKSKKKSKAAAAE